MFTCQVSQLYDVVQKWDAMSTSIPQVVQRLVAVKELHEQGNTPELKLVYRVAASSCKKSFSKLLDSVVMTLLLTLLPSMWDTGV